jgi:hypothetical protein
VTATVLSGLVLVAVIGVLLFTPAERAGNGPDSPLPNPGAAPVGREVIVFSADSLAALIHRDPFRLDRSPAAIRYDPNGIRVDAPPPPAPRPQLLVTGILWGPRPTAIIEGIPGTEGPRLVRPGDEINGFRVLHITRDVLKIRGVDTTWTLTIREPWR